MPTLAELTLAADAIADSRGRPTVRVRARAGGHIGVGDVPAGASKGRDEARTVPVPEAVAHVTGPLLNCVRAVPGDLREPATIVAADRAMAAAAGDNFAVWGANATLPVSRALWRLSAGLRAEPLWRTLRSAYGRPVRAPMPLCLFNVFNGGLHAVKAGESLGRDRIDLQEIMVVPVRAESSAAALQCGDAIDRALKARLVRQFGEKRVTRADEAGLCVAGLGDSSAAIAHVLGAITDAGFEPGRDVQLALDVAASSFLVDGGYRLMGQVLPSAQMVAWLVALTEQHPGVFLSVEDGLGEDDWPAWSALTRALEPAGVVTVGDDLFVTQLTRLQRGIAERAAGAVLIKVNQNGTVAGTLEVMQAAADAGMKCIVSHRSGETLDDSIADLAVACGAFALKSGDPQPPVDFPNESHWVRRRKYLRLVAIEAQAPE